MGLSDCCFVVASQSATKPKSATEVSGKMIVEKIAITT